MGDLLSNALGLIIGVGIIWLAVQAIGWYLRWKTKKDLMAEIEQEHLSYYNKRKDEFNARDSITNVDAARKFLRDRASK